MCGRFEIRVPTKELLAMLDIPDDARPDDLPETVERFDIRPTDAVLIATDEQPKQLQSAYWGFLGNSQNPEPGKPALRPFNARDDKLDGDWWRFAAEHQRCLVPATAFFEWREVPGQKKKQPVRFGLRDGGPFCFAGLWSRQMDRLSCTIITTTPSPLVAAVHDRMPAILTREAMMKWMAPGGELAQLRPLLVPYPPELMVAQDVDSLIPGAVQEVKPQLELF
jgi:putative SOS response-associated peptidase YedK